MNSRGPVVSHLAYADDIVIFTAGNTRSIKLVMKEVRKYEAISGQMVKQDKSFFLTDPKVSPSRINRIRTTTGFLNKEFPFTYLGCPIFVGRKRIVYFDGLVAKIVMKLNGWKGKLLSYGDKLTLVKHILQAIPTYTLAAMNPPKATYRTLEKYFANFF
ncbi:uncharacterized protein LOC107811732 [Nicotiana tabacum]